MRVASSAGPGGRDGAGRVGVAPRAHRVAVLDGVRALAILDVVAFHAGLLAGGGLGVTIFFVLSGYLITGILMKPGCLTGRGLATFYARRLLRLFPALAVVVGFCALFGLLVLHGHARHLDLTEALTSVLYVQDFYLGHGRFTPDFGYLGHTWSLGIEEQFYLLWPWLLAGVLRISGRPAARIAVIGVGIVAIAAWRAHLAGEGLNAHVGLNIDTQADALLVGCALALAMPGLSVRLPRHQRALDAGALAALVVLAAMSSENVILHTPGRIGYLLVSLSSAVLVCRLLLPGAGRIGRGLQAALGWRPVAAIGLGSYSLYLWHPVIFAIAKRNLHIDTVPRELAAAPALALVIGVVTWLSFRYVETPLQRYKDGRLPDSGPAVIEVEPAGGADQPAVLAPM